MIRFWVRIQPSLAAMTVWHTLGEEKFKLQGF